MCSTSAWVNVKRPARPELLLQQRRRDRLLEQIQQSRLIEIHDRDEQVEIEVTADHRSRAERRARVGAQALHPPPDDLPHALGQTQIADLAHQPPPAAVFMHDRA